MNTLDRTTVFAIIDMIQTRMSELKEEQRLKEEEREPWAYNLEEFTAVKDELRVILAKLWAEADKLEEDCFK